MSKRPKSPNKCPLSTKQPIRNPAATSNDTRIHLSLRRAKPLDNQRLGEFRSGEPA
jgi:hypothetical protein